MFELVRIPSVPKKCNSIKTKIGHIGLITKRLLKKLWNGLHSFRLFWGFYTPKYICILSFCCFTNALTLAVVNTLNLTDCGRKRPGEDLF